MEVIDQVDLLYKISLGRVGFDKNRPWYEEEYNSPNMLANDDIMGEKIPHALPSLLKGGILNINIDGFGFDSNGTKVSTRPVVTARIRVPLTHVAMYNNNGFYVYKNENLKYACKNYGYVLERLKEDNLIEVTDDNFYVTGGFVCFTDSVWDEDTTFFVSFYEYTGVRGCTGIVQTPPPEDVTSNDMLLKSSDDVHEGIVNLFYNETRFRNSFSLMTSDDLSRGKLEQERELSVNNMLKSTFDAIPKFLHELSVSKQAEHFNIGVFDQYFHDFLSKITSDSVSEGSKNMFLSEKSLLQLLSTHILDTSLVKESPNSLYFTEDRVKHVMDTLTLDVTNVKNAVHENKHSKLEMIVQSLTEKLETISTDDVHEGSRLYYNDLRIYEHPGFISVSNAVNSITIDTLFSQVSHENLPITNASVHHILDEWIASKSLEDIADGDTRRLITYNDVTSACNELEYKIPKTTDDLEQGRNKFFSEKLILDVLSNTNVDVLLDGDGTFSSDKVAVEVHKILDKLVINLDDVADGVEYQKLSGNDIRALVEERVALANVLVDERVALVDGRVASVDGRVAAVDERVSQQVSQLDEVLSVNSLFDDRLNVTEEVLPVISSCLLSVQCEVNALKSDLLDDGIYFTNDRVYNAIANTLTTSDVKESEPFLYFNDERCLSVCATKFVEHLSVCSSLITSEVEKIVETTGRQGAQIQDTKRELEIVNESVSSAVREIEGLGVHVDQLVVSISVSSSVVTENYEECKRDSSHALTLLQTLSDEVNATSGRLEESFAMISTNAVNLMYEYDLLKMRQSDVEEWRDKLSSKDVSESETNLYFTECRSLSVHRGLYDRVQNVEKNVTALKTSSTTLSDDRLKFNETPLVNGLSVLHELNPLGYKMVLSLGQNESEAFDDVGFIAQEVAEIEALSHAVVPGGELTPWSLDYHSITTFAVAALQELTLSVSSIHERTTDQIEEGHMNKFLTSDNLTQALSSMSTDDIPEGVSNRYRTEYIGVDLKLEELKFMLHQIDTDMIPEGSVNLYNKARDVMTTDDVQEAGSLYFTPERCKDVIDQTLGKLSVDDIDETDTKGYLTLSRLIQELRFVTADHIANGLTNRFLNLETFMDLGIDTDKIPEGDQNFYLTTERVRSAATGMSIDLFIDGNTNLFCSRDNVELRLNSLTTNALPEAPGRRYVSRDAYFELNISVGDILGHETLARNEEVEQALSLTSLFHTEQLENAMSVSSLTLSVSITRLENELSTATNHLDTKINDLQLDVNSKNTDLLNRLSLSHDTLAQEINEIDVSLSSAHVHIDSNEQRINTLDSLVSVNASNISIHNIEQQAHNASTRELISFNSETINTNALAIQNNTSRIIQVQQTFDNKILSLSNTTDQSVLSLSNHISLVETDLNDITTDDVPQTDAHKYVSNQSMLDMSITTDFIAEGNLNKYTTVQSVRDALANLTTSDLPEGDNHPYVSKVNVIATGLKPDELDGFSSSINDHLRSISSDYLPEGGNNLYFTTDRVNSILQNTTTDDIAEGTGNKYFSDQRVRNTLSSMSSSDIKEGSNLYFTEERVFQTLSLGTSDSVPQGSSNLYVTKNNVLSINLDVSELNDSLGALLTKESFLSRVHAHLTTDEISEGMNKYVSHDSVLQVIDDLSTDHLQEGSNLYLTTERVNNILDESFESVLSQTLKSSHIVDTGLTPLDIGARSATLSIHASEIVETPDASFFNSTRFNTQFQSKTTDDLREGNTKYFTTDRVIQSIQSIGTLSVSLTSSLPGVLEVLITVSNEQALGGQIELCLGDPSKHTSQYTFELTNDVISKVISDLDPGELLVTTTLTSRYGSQSNEQTIVIDGSLPYIQDVSFVEFQPGFANKIIVALGGHGACEIFIASNGFVIQNKYLNLFSQNEIQIDLNCVFGSASFILKKEGVIVDSRTELMNVGLILPMKEYFNILTTSAFDSLNTIPFADFNITIQHDDNTNDTLNGNLFHSKQTPRGAIISATNDSIQFGTTKGVMKVTLINNKGFVRFS